MPVSCRVWWKVWHCLLSHWMGPFKWAHSLSGLRLSFTRESHSCAAILTEWPRQHTPPLLLFINNVKQMRRGEKDGAQGKGGEGSVVEDKNYKQNSKCETELSDAERVQRESNVLQSQGGGGAQIRAREGPKVLTRCKRVAPIEERRWCW